MPFKKMAAKMATWRGARPTKETPGGDRLQGGGVMGKLITPSPPAVLAQGQLSRCIHGDAFSEQQLTLDPVAACAAGGEANVRLFLQLLQ
jgi:hypothetical protein